MLENKVAVITGSTKGIGFATAKLFLQEGAKVVILGKEPKETEIINSLSEQYKDKIIVAYPNLNNEQDINDVIDKTVGKFGKVDILINNAGISSKTPLEEYTMSEFQQIIDVNLTAMFLFSKLIIKTMKNNGGGVILNTSSIVSINGQPSGCAYPTTKFAVNGLTKSLARELGKYNIRVNAVAPGIVNTNMTSSLPKEMIEPLIKEIPLGKMAEPQDIANAFLFLASSMASHITGAILSVDGGQVL